MSWELSRRRGWLKYTNSEQAADWQLYCFEHGLDCIVVTKRDGFFELDCSVNPSHAFSELGYMEVSDLMKAHSIDYGSMGKCLRADPSQFSFRIPAKRDPQEFVTEVQAILRRDRTSRRAAELMAHPAPAEGMALALQSDGLWPDHGPNERVYVLETGLNSGRCLVFKHLHPPLVDMPLEQFQILPDCDV